MKAVEILVAAYTGDYPTHGSVGEADSVIAQSFGFREEGGVSISGPINESLAYFANKFELPVIAQREIAAHVRADLLAAEISKHREEDHYLDSDEALAQAAIHLGNLGLRKSIVVAHANHVTRVDAQAQKHGIDTVVVPGMTRLWDSKSEQWWARSRVLWVAREAVAYPVLKLQKKI